MSSLERLAAVLAWPAVVAARLGGWILPLLALVIVFDVVGRKFFDTGSSKLQELEWHLHGAALMLAFGFCYLRDAHVRVDLLRGLFANRAKLWLELLGILLFIVPYMLLLIDYGFEFALRAFTRNEGSPGGTGLPMRWIIKAFLPIGFALMLAAAVSVALRCVLLLRRDGRAEALFHGPGVLNPDDAREGGDGPVR